MTAVAAETLPRPRARAFAIAAATLWLPTAAPMVLGIMRDSHSAATSYLLFLPTIPGVIFPVLLGLDDLWFVLAAAAPTLAALAALYAAARELPRRWLHAAQGLAMALVALEAIGFAHALCA